MDIFFIPLQNKFIVQRDNLPIPEEFVEELVFNLEGEVEVPKFTFTSKEIPEDFVPF